MASQRNANSRPTRQTYNILINFLAVKGEPSKAEHYLNLMRKDGFKPDVDLFTVIVSAYERKRDPISALNLMESMRADGYDFYEMKLLDAAFKQGVKVINNVVKKGQVYTTEYNKYGNATAD
jgi:pentatricopeptide repeat protein